MEIPATDRRELAKQTTGKTSRWPRTERRETRIRSVLSRRQPDLTIVLENVHDPHNVSAVLRSCDAVGIYRAHAIYTVEEPPARAYARTTSGSGAKWVEVDQHQSVTGCFAALRADGFHVIAAALGETSRDLYDLELTGRVAIVFGNEMRGVSAEAAAAADGLMKIPMLGMIESLNISVACAVTLYEAMRERQASGAYGEPKFSDEELADFTLEWLHR